MARLLREFHINSEKSNPSGDLLVPTFEASASHNLYQAEDRFLFFVVDPTNSHVISSSLETTWTNFRKKTKTLAKTLINWSSLTGPSFGGSDWPIRRTMVEVSRLLTLFFFNIYLFPDCVCCWLCDVNLEHIHTLQANRAFPSTTSIMAIELQRHATQRCVVTDLVWDGWPNAKV